MNNRTAKPYIPPKAAIEIEIERGWHGESVPEQFRPLRIWGRPWKGHVVKSEKPNCNCTTKYLVYVRSLPPILRKNVPPRQRVTVCACVGKVVTQ